MLKYLKKINKFSKIIPLAFFGYYINYRFSIIETEISLYAPFYKTI